MQNSIILSHTYINEQVWLSEKKHAQSIRLKQKNH
jgi:hypothetical protein